MVELYGTVLNATAATGADVWLTFTRSQDYTVPQGYTKADIFCVGGGMGQSGNSSTGGGGGGYTRTAWSIGVSEWHVLSIVVGAGTRDTPGGTSRVSRSGATLCNADGGTHTLRNGYANSGTNGGSGGGGLSTDGVTPGANGGSDGGYGGTNGSYGLGGIGQGNNTRAFGQSSGTLYSGGGGGGGSGSAGNEKYTSGGSGGAGGGGRGGRGAYRYYAGDDEYRYVGGENGSNGTANTGGGAGGGGYVYYNGKCNPGSSGFGGSGIVLIHIY